MVVVVVVVAVRVVVAVGGIGIVRANLWKIQFFFSFDRTLIRLFALDFMHDWLWHSERETAIIIKLDYIRRCSAFFFSLFRYVLIS